MSAIPQLPVIFLLAGAAGAGYFADDLSAIHLPATSAASPACNIKGNISEITGERIYHVPGQKYYDRTVIEPSRGERWFCSEQDARLAG